MCLLLCLGLFTIFICLSSVRGFVSVISPPETLTVLVTVRKEKVVDVFPFNEILRAVKELPQGVLFGSLRIQPQFNVQLYENPLPVPLHCPLQGEYLSLYFNTGRFPVYCNTGTE
jgi:hypothetical protein